MTITFATPSHLPSICPFTRPYVLISALSMYLPPVLCALIHAPATHFLGARILTTLTTSTPPAAFSALPQHLSSPFSVIVKSSQYLFQRGPTWIWSRLWSLILDLVPAPCCEPGPLSLKPQKQLLTVHSVFSKPRYFHSSAL